MHKNHLFVRYTTLRDDLCKCLLLRLLSNTAVLFHRVITVHIWCTPYSDNVLETPSHKTVLRDHVHSQYPQFISAESSNFSYLLILGYGDRSCLISPLILFRSIPPSPVHHAACCTAWWDKNHLSSSELKNSFFCSAEPVKKMLYLLQ